MTSPESAQTEFQKLIVELRELQERILQRRGGKPIDVDALLEQLREERDDENLHNSPPMNVVEPPIHAQITPNTVQSNQNSQPNCTCKE